MLRVGIDPENLYRATFIYQDGLCCCNMALISFRLFRKNLGNLGDFFGQMVYRPPWQKISRTPMDVCTLKQQCVTQVMHVYSHDCRRSYLYSIEYSIRVQ